MPLAFAALFAPSLLAPALLAQTSLPSTRTDAERPVAKAVETTAPIKVDGRLEEDVWRTARPLTGFTQAEPREGEPATERTEVWVAQDRASLYVAAYLHDSGEPTVNDIRKDFDENSQDGFQVILDTFRDRRNGYVFMTNPGGARGDRQVANEGREINISWDAIWKVETQRVADGWTLEMEIPFRALRFHPDEDRWGINFARLLRRNNEVDYWAPVPRAYNLYRLTLAGDLTGLPKASAGRDLRVKPFVLGGEIRATGGESFSSQSEVGLDVKYRLSEGLTLDVTANPDFAQVEADEQRVNLTQFSLFFQEKREFFLENSGLFYVGDAARNIRVRLTPTPDEDLLLFFSRRIGISRDGRQVPIQGGVRLTGQAAGLVVGGLWMRTDPLDSAPSSDYAVVRVRKNVFRASDVGGIFMMRDAVDRPDDYNRVYGLDSYIRFPGQIDWSTYFVRSETAGFGGGQYAWRTSLNREGNFMHLKLGVMQLGDGFNDDLGFFKRTGVRKYFIDWGFRPRPEAMRRHGVREMHPHIVWNYYEDLSGHIVAKRLHSGYTFFLEDGGFWELSVNPAFERIDKPFSIDRRIDPIPAGSYGWNEWMLRGNSDASAPLSVGLTGIVGGLWSGSQRTVRGTVTFKPSYRFRTTLSWQRTSADLSEPDAAFVKTFWTARTNYSFNKNMFIDALLQYDPATKLFNSNVRFNFIHHPLSDLFIVWNEQRFMTDENISPGRSLTVKLTQMVAF